MTKYPGSKPTYVRVQEKPFGALVPGEMVIIPSPQAVEDALWTTTRGETSTQADLRSILAEQHSTDNACPVMTGFQLRLVAETAVAALEEGVEPDEVAPFWRVLEPDSKIAGRLPDGANLITDLRSRERKIGCQIAPRLKQYGISPIPSDRGGSGEIPSLNVVCVVGRATGSAAAGSHTFDSDDRRPCPNLP
ncbi:MAG: hypothetical protein GY925_09520 [Actinomycetia bacterium]|nr:hypothetical protein [Actinomycetes bacterium]